MLRVRALLGWVGLGWGLSLCLGCLSNAAGPLAEPPSFEPAQQSKCAVTKSQQRPLVVEWPAADRAALEALSKQGLVVVRYVGCEMELLAQCHATGGYRYTPTTVKQDRVVIRDEDELYANVPLGAASLEGKLASAGQLDVAMTIVGRYDADRAAVAPTELEGRCQRATHVVTGLTAGAFAFFAGAEGEVGAGVSVMGAGAGARSGAKRELLNRDGDEQACSAASGSDEAPPEGCGALLRVEVAPLGAAAGAPTSPTSPAASVAVMAAAPTADLDGPVIRSGPGIVRVHLASPDPGTQLRGDGVSLLQPVGDGFASQGPSTILCRPPCDKYLDARVGQSLVVTSPDMPDSMPFSLYEHEGDVTLQVEPGSGGMQIGSAVLGVPSTFGVIGGIATLITGAAISASAPSGNTSGEDALVVGGIMTGVSAPLFTLAIVLGAYGATDVTISTAGDAISQ